MINPPFHPYPNFVFLLLFTTAVVKKGVRISSIFTTAVVNKNPPNFDLLLSYSTVVVKTISQFWRFISYHSGSKRDIPILIFYYHYNKKWWNYPDYDFLHFFATAEGPEFYKNGLTSIHYRGNKQMGLHQFRRFTSFYYRGSKKRYKIWSEYFTTAVLRMKLPKVRLFSTAAVVLKCYRTG